MVHLMAKRVEQGDAKLKNFVIKTIKWLDLSISVLPGNFNSVPSGEKKYFRPFFLHGWQIKNLIRHGRMSRVLPLVEWKLHTIF